MAEIGVEPGVLQYMETRRSTAEKIWLRCVVERASTKTGVLKSVRKRTRSDNPTKTSHIQDSSEVVDML